MQEYDFELEMQVRDYECDIQRIVNNSVYQNYLEHCRHKFLNTAGLGFAELHNNGIDAVVIRAELDYKSPLLPGDEFIVQLKLAKQGRLKIVFLQEILRKTDKKLMLKGKITTVLLKSGRPISHELLIKKIVENGLHLPEIS